MTPKLYIPGPIAVSEATFKAMCHPMIGHRSGDFVTLYNEVQAGLQTLAATKDPVYLSTSSSWGVMEGALRNVVKKKVLCCMNGAFSDKWLEVAHRCGLKADGIQSEWGEPILPEQVRKALSTGEYDAMTLIHNETSTGTMSPIKEIMDVVREFPEVISIVDTVSSFSVVPTPKDELGIDVLITGTQKALALPPGTALLSVSKRALDRAKTVEGRGYYFDFIEFQKNHEKSNTPSTPAISLIFGLQHKVREILAEGLENRYARHVKTNDMLRAWVKKHGMELFPQEQYSSRSLVCVKTPEGLDMNKFNKMLKEQYNCMINTGYGKIKGITFRISNMGDETVETIGELVTQLDSILAQLR
ncbi:MAG: alanine--glyoxylate aminotransferase family protein [Opitutales bacterium]|nr:alanine--glyoxylate aminotransferase family protein [Opitutales bacterium]